MRMVSTSLNDLAALLPPDLSERPRFGADERPATPHLLFVVDGGFLPPGNHVVPPDGLHGVTVLDLPARWDELDDASCLRLLFEARRTGPWTRDASRLSALRLREATRTRAGRPVRPGDRRGVRPPADAAAHRDRGRHRHRRAARSPGPWTSWTCSVSATCTSSTPRCAWRQRPARDRLRVPIGLGDGGSVDPPRHQGVRPAGHGPARPGHRRDRLRQVGVPAHAGARPGDDPLPRAAQHGAGRLQGRRDVRRDVGDAARLRGDHQPGPGAHPRRPHAGRPVRRDGAPPGAAARGRQLRLDPRLREGPRGRRGRSSRCRRCSSWSTSSPRCCRPSRSSSTCSSRSAGSAARSACTCCSPRSGSRRAGCAAWSRTCPTGSACARSAPPSRAPCSAYPTPTSCPPVPGLGYLKPDPSTLLRFKAAYVSGPPSGRARVRRDEGGTLRGHPAVHDLRGADARRRPTDAEPEPVAAPPAGRAGVAARRRRRPHGGPRPGGAPGLAAAARRARHPRRPDARPRRGPRSSAWSRPSGARSAGWSMPARHRRPAARAAPRHPHASTSPAPPATPSVVGGPRSGKSTLLRTIVTSMALTTTPLESQFFVLDFGGGTFAADGRAAARRRRRHPLRARRRTPDRRRGDRASSTAARRTSAPRASTRSRPTARRRAAGPGRRRVRRRVPRRRRLEHAARRLRRPRAASCSSWPPRGLTFGLHLVVASGRWADFRAAMRDMFGTRLELRLGDPLDSEIDRRVAALVPTGPTRPRPGAGQAALPRRAAAHRRRPPTPRPSATASTTWSSAVARGLDRPDRPEAAAAARADRARRRPRARPPPPGCDEQAAAARHQREGAGPGRRSTRTASRTCWSSATGSPARARCCARYVREIMRTRTPQQAQLVVVDYRRSLLGEVPEEYLLNYLTSATQAAPALQRPRDVPREPASPAPTSPPSSCATGRGGPAPRCSCSSTTTTWSPPSRARRSHALQPLLAQARDVGLHVIVARRSGGASRALYEPVIQSMRDLAMPGPDALRQPRRGPAARQPAADSPPPGRGRLVTRDRGVETIQLACTDPTT